eukprot:s3515_g8.t1
MPATGDNAQPGQEPAPRPRWGRQDTGLPPPVFTAPRPDIDQMPPDLDHLLTRLVLFAPEYKPEVIDVDLPTGCTEAQVLAALRTQRAPSIAEAFPDVVFVHPQPVTTRASLLAIARLPRDPAIEVYVHDRALPLLDHDAIGIRTGYSVTFAYALQRAFAVTDIHSMLQDPLVWDWGVPLPFWAGTWSLLLTDDEPMQLMHEAPGLPPDRAALAEALEYDLDRLVSQATAPNIGDHFDFGIWSLDTCIVSQEVRPAPGAVLYALDMRPILCGLTWGLAEQGWVLADPIVNRFRSLCSMGFQPVLSGGRPGFAAGLPCRFVGPGTVLAVTFVPVEPPGTISQAEQAALIPTDEASTPAASTGAEGARAADPLASMSDASFASGDAGASSGQQLAAYAAHAAVPLEAFRLTDLTRTWGFLWAPAPGALLSSGLGSLLDMFLFTVGFLLLYASRAIRSVRTMRCFWLLLAVGWGVQSCRAMQTLPPASVHPGAPAPKPSCTAVAREGEVAGLLAAALAATAAFSDRDILFLSDCTAALGIAAGTHVYEAGTLSQAMRHAHQFRHTAVGRRDTYDHVRAHQGHVGNEMADVLSKMAAAKAVASCGLQAAQPTIATWLSDGAPYLPWAGSVVRQLGGDLTLPPPVSVNLADDTQHRGLSACQLLEPFLPQGAFAVTGPSAQRQLSHSVPGSKASVGVLYLAVATFNTLSLGPMAESDEGYLPRAEGLAYRPGRAPLLAAQLTEHGVQAVCLQETRAAPHFSRVGGFLRYASGAERGQWGTEWWFLDHHDLFQMSSNAAKISFQAQSFAVVHSDPRRLFIRMRTQYLAICFDAWRARHADGPAGSDGVWWRQADLSVAAHHAILRQWCSQLRRMCRDDRACYLGGLADQISQGPSTEVFSKLHALLGHRRKKPFCSEPLPALKLTSGESCTDGDQILARWRQHFGGLEAGKNLDFTELARRTARCIQTSAQLPRSWPVPDSLLDMPTEADIQRLLVSAKGGKAPGPDGIPSEFGRKFARQLAPHLHRIALKTALRGSEPQGFKSGRAVWFYKGEGDMSCCSSYRAILLLPSWSKILHQSLRPPLKRHFEARSPTLQLGGKTGISVVYGSHLIRGAARLATLRGQTHFTLFTDIASAFYTVIQQLVARRGSGGTAAEDISQACSSRLMS